MANFTYVAKDNSGVEVTGFLAGGSIDDVIVQLHGRGLAVLHVAEDAHREGVGAFKDQWISLWRGKASTRDLALFSRQLATVIEAGIPLVKGLRGLSSEGGKGVIAKATQSIANHVERGESLSDAMAKHPEAFNEMYLSMVRAGERAGTMDRIIVELANYLEKVDDIKTKVKSAMSYPVFILVFVAIATLFLIVQIVPTFAGIYEELGQDLPAMTQMVLNASNFIRGNALTAVAGALAIGLLTTFVLRTPRGRHFKDLAAMRLPLFGPIVTKSVMSRFARTFSILIGSGLPIIESLDLVKGSVGNLVVSDALEEVKGLVASGHGVTESFRATKQFPEMVLQLMATGEEAGELDTMLARSSDFYDRQVEAAVHGISSLIEPVMIVLVGGIIGFIVLSMFLPIFGMGDAMMAGQMNM